MIKYPVYGIIILCIFNVTAYAGPKTTKTVSHKQEIGLGVGALIGGLLGGPPGAIIGAAGGIWYGDRQKKKDDAIAGLEQRLREKQTELAGLQDEFKSLEASSGMELQKVKLERQGSAMDKLSRGVTLTIFFRTNSFNVDKENALRIEHLAQYLKDFPEIQLNLEAYADRRGTENYNLQLSRQRARAVKEALIRGGLQEQRIHSQAHGETMAKAADGDFEGYVFDRRVKIHLSLESKTYAVN